jgi:two-component system, OmpR family, response regulator CpxR
MRSVLFALIDPKILEAPRPGAVGRGSHRHFGRAMKPKRTILCIDDNEQSLSIRKIMLETRGYRVVACHNGLDALEQFKQGGIDLVLSDLIMPGLDGHRLIEEIKKISPQTPAILFSGKVKIYERNLHADVFLPKGMYAPVELLERIRLLLVRKRGPKRLMPISMANAGGAGVAAS